MNNNNHCSYIFYIFHCIYAVKLYICSLRSPCEARNISSDYTSQYENICLFILFSLFKCVNLYYFFWVNNIYLIFHINFHKSSPYHKIHNHLNLQSIHPILNCMILCILSENKYIYPLFYLPAIQSMVYKIYNYYKNSRIL